MGQPLLLNDGRQVIAVTICNLPSRGGVYNHILNLARSLNAQKYRLYIVYYSPDPSLDLECELRDRPDVTVLRVPALWTKSRLFLPALAYLARFYRRAEVSAVYSVFAYTDLIATAAARLAGVPVVVSSIRGRLVSEDNPLWEQWVYRLLYPLAARGIDRFFAVSEASRAEAVQAFGLKPGKLEVVVNGLNLSDFEGFDCAEEGPVTVSCVGRLQYEKGVDDFIQSASLTLREYPATHFAVIGDGPDREKLQNLTRELGITSQVEFCGWRQDARSLMSKHAVIVLSSRREGMPWTILEAMALRKPVVAYNVGGVSEVVVEGQTGFLVEPGRPDLLAQRIGQLLSDGALRQRLGQAGRRRVEEQFSNANTFRRLEDSLAELLGGHTQ